MRSAVSKSQLHRSLDCTGLSDVPCFLGAMTASSAYTGYSERRGCAKELAKQEHSTASRGCYWWNWATRGGRSKGRNRRGDPECHGNARSRVLHIWMVVCCADRESIEYGTIAEAYWQLCKPTVYKTGWFSQSSLWLSKILMVAVATSLRFVSHRYRSVSSRSSAKE